MYNYVSRILNIDIFYYNFNLSVKTITMGVFGSRPSPTGRGTSALKFLQS